ncbi:hypothetical protein GOP47_0012595 [Adiantum capillus-veneris]|uniref:Uncharacterized protein n=1 Tax=Adiantum capillus-veneris TaxID=13818 RepID=A0A9D4ZEK2_ADICA|nr:hypothetical protein GOP47_0012595 [Adiantum capillus-veneris]
MATRGLLHHPLQARPPSHIADPRHLLPRRSSLPYGVPAFRRRPPSTPTLRSVKCMKVEDQAVGKAEARDTTQPQLESSNMDAVEYVNKAYPGPIVEVDPVTVFRRIIAERRTSLAMARAKQQADDAAIKQSTAPLPFILGSKWSGKSTIAIALALVLLVLAAMSYFLRSRPDREKQTGLTPTEEKDNDDASPDNGRRKLVKDTIKAPESVLTAMAIGAASVGRSKGHTGSIHDTMHAGNGNLVDSQTPAEGADIKLSLNTTGTINTEEDKKTEGHEMPTFGQASYNPSSIGAFGSFKPQNAGVDVAEGPWFAQAADDPSYPQLESSIQSASAAQVVSDNVLAHKQEVHASSEAVVNKFVSEVSVSEVRYETLPLNNVVDGEFLGEVVSVSVATEEASDSSYQVEAFNSEEPEDDADLADSSAIVEKLEQMIGHEPITFTEDKNVASETDVSKHNTIADLPALELPNDQSSKMVLDTDIGSTDSDIDDSESDEHYEATQSFTPLAVGKVASEEESQSEVDDEGQDTSSLDVEENGETIKLLSGVDQSSDEEVASWTHHEPVPASQTSEELHTNGNLSLDQFTNQDSGAMAYSSTADAVLQSLEEDSTGAMAHCTTADAALQSLEEDIREDNKKALEAALPALAIGVGTVGTLFGVAGGLQVVGFAALASFLSQDFFWAKSREELYQELKGITNRQKLLDFLARRNILHNQERSSTKGPISIGKIAEEAGMASKVAEIKAM